MKYIDISDKIFLEGKEKFDQMECYIKTSETLELQLSKGEIAKYAISNTEGLSFRGIKDDKVGYSYTEKIDDSSVEILLKDAYENKSIVDSMDVESIFEGSKEYLKVVKEDIDLKEYTLEKKVDLLKKIERYALDYSEEIIAVNYCLYQEEQSQTFIKNTRGLSLEESDMMGTIYLNVVVKRGEEIKVGSNLKISRRFEEFDPKEIAEKACQEAISSLGSKPVSSGKYNIILENDMVGTLISLYMSMFDADNVQKDMSLMKGRLGEKIGVEGLNIREEPTLKGGYNIRSFDDEGVATKGQDIIKKGVLNTYLYNIKTSIKDKRESTGNGYRSSYKSSLGTSYTNLDIMGGEKDFDQLLASLDEGILITSLQGLHAGVNSVSGDFSLSSSGYKIEKGKIAGGVNQITIAGNIIELFKNIVEFGNDKKMTTANIYTPSIIVKDIVVSGE